MRVRGGGVVHVTLGSRGRNVALLKSSTLAGRTLGDDTTLTDRPPDLRTLFAQLVEQQQELQRRLDEDMRDRRIALAIAAASALFAAIKLGIIAFPRLRARVTRSRPA